MRLHDLVASDVCKFQETTTHSQGWTNNGCRVHSHDAAMCQSAESSGTRIVSKFSIEESASLEGRSGLLFYFTQRAQPLRHLLPWALVTSRTLPPFAVLPPIQRKIRLLCRDVVGFQHFSFLSGISPKRHPACMLSCMYSLSLFGEKSIEKFFS